MRNYLFILVFGALLLSCSGTVKHTNLCGGMTCHDGQSCVADMCAVTCGGDVCSANQLCEADKCQAKCGKVVCSANELCVADMCKAACGKAVCGADQICVANACKAKCGKVVCNAEQLCVADVCKEKCGDIICASNKVCVDGFCQIPGAPRECGDKLCKKSELCVSGVCTKRLVAVKDGAPCDAETFLSFCKDGKTLVSCSEVSSKVMVDKCLNSSKCVMQAQENNAACVKADPICQNAGQMFNRCYTTKEDPAKSYLTHLVCEYGMDDKLYPFSATPNETECKSACSDENTCPRTSFDL